LVAGVIVLGIYAWATAEWSSDRIEAAFLFVAALELAALAWLYPKSVPESLGSYLARLVRKRPPELVISAIFFIGVVLLMLWKKSTG
jgi:hypothetical protein